MVVYGLFASGTKQEWNDNEYEIVPSSAINSPDWIYFEHYFVYVCEELMINSISTTTDSKAIARTFSYTEKIAECTFSQEALPRSIENYWRKVTQDHLMMRNFNRINKSTSCLTSVFQNTSILFLQDFGPQCITGKMYRRHLFRNHGFISFEIDCFDGQ